MSCFACAEPSPPHHVAWSRPCTDPAAARTSATSSKPARYTAVSWPALARQLIEAGPGALGIVPGVDDVERHVRVLQLVVETLDRDLERGPARVAQRRPGAGDRQQRADPDLRLAGLRRRRQRTECKHGRERDDRTISQRTAEDSKNAAFYTTAPLPHTLIVAGEWPSFGGVGSPRPRSPGPG